MSAAPTEASWPATIWICDDVEDLRVLMSMTLEQVGHTVVGFEGGRRMLAALRDAATLPDLLLLDVQMPEMDGWAVLQELRDDPRFDQVRVLMCTVKFSQADLAYAWELGCDGYLTKPFDLEHLRVAVKAVVLRAPDEVRAFRTQQLQGFTEQLR